MGQSRFPGILIPFGFIRQLLVSAYPIVWIILTGNDVFLYCGETQLQIEFESGENRKTDLMNSIKNNRLTLAKRIKPLPIETSATQEWKPEGLSVP